MKTWAYYLFLIEFIVAVPIGKETPTILKYENMIDGLGSYRYSFDTSNGISQQEEGALIDANDPYSAIKVKGSYSYTGPDGIVYTVTYIADENGFQPFGDYLPRPLKHLPPQPILPFPPLPLPPPDKFNPLDSVRGVPTPGVLPIGVPVTDKTQTGDPLSGAELGLLIG